MHEQVSKGESLDWREEVRERKREMLREKAAAEQTPKTSEDMQGEAFAPTRAAMEENDSGAREAPLSGKVHRIALGTITVPTEALDATSPRSKVSTVRDYLLLAVESEVAGLVRVARSRKLKQDDDGLQRILAAVSDQPGA